MIFMVGLLLSFLTSTSLRFMVCFRNTLHQETNTGNHTEKYKLQTRLSVVTKESGQGKGKGFSRALATVHSAVPEALAACLATLADETSTAESLQELVAFSAGLHVGVTVCEDGGGQLSGVVQTHGMVRPLVREAPVGDLKQRFLLKNDF